MNRLAEVGVACLHAERVGMFPEPTTCLPADHEYMVPGEGMPPNMKPRSRYEPSC